MKHFKKNFRAKINIGIIISLLIMAMLALSSCGKAVSNQAKNNNKTRETNKNNEVSLNTNGSLKVHFIDVGQADSILITENNHNMLIDAGNNDDSELVTTYLKKQGISNLDYVVGTHPHEDHIGGLDAVINEFNIGTIYMPKKVATTKTYKDVIKAIKNKNMKITLPKRGSTFKLGEATCTIVAPIENKKYKDTNDYSIVIKLRYKDTSFLFTGDAEGASEKEILKGGYDIKVDVLKVGHHGSRTSTIDAFLKKVSPKYAVISCGKENKYGHPHKETIQKLKDKNIQLYRTDKSGTIIAISNGSEINFDKKPVEK
ncbi:ComEC/Rec2 family competence protein [Clostridium ganghwense]|uniref:ComEC/Rec2 family competence protein n=1 Tax=Clostridium ganghwense TaxID=312089 RepID=A0ABT4CKN1_9CLOT|nr:ComEC/Rec2 family competence protein [Clostridium ganghwense]MCY6369608.1 ComEC/Rec2 family competence protein [Clostridium ganghwense]